MDEINRPKSGKGLPSPNVSVVLCTYNGESYLRQTLQSISEQTQSPTELIAVDDKSSDNTVSILEEFRNTSDFTMHIHLNDSHLGVNGNFEKAIHLCSGEYIFFADQDDIWMPQKIEDTIHAFKSTRCGAIFSNARRIDENGQMLRDDLWRSVPGQFTGYRNRVAFLKRLIKGNVVTGSTLAIRSVVLKHVLPFPKTESFLYDAWIAIICTAIPEIGIVPLHKKLMHYRVHGSQYTARFRGDVKGTYGRAQQMELFMTRAGYLTQVYLRLSHFMRTDSTCISILRQAIDFWQSRATHVEHQTFRSTISCFRHFTGGSYHICSRRPVHNLLKDIFNLYRPNG